MATAIEDLLKEKGIKVLLQEGALAFTPAKDVDESLRGMLATEAKTLYRVALEVRDHLQALSRASEANPMAWKALHSRLTRHWPDDPATNRVHAHLVSWSAACLMHTEATRALKRTLTPNVRGGRLADLSFSSRWIPTAERQLVSTALLWPDIREKIMSLQVRRDAG